MRYGNTFLTAILLVAVSCNSTPPTTTIEPAPLMVDCQDPAATRTITVKRTFGFETPVNDTLTLDGVPAPLIAVARRGDPRAAIGGVVLVWHVDVAATEFFGGERMIEATLRYQVELADGTIEDRDPVPLELMVEPGPCDPVPDLPAPPVMPVPPTPPPQSDCPAGIAFVWHPSQEDGSFFSTAVYAVERLSGGTPCRLIDGAVNATQANPALSRNGSKLAHTELVDRDENGTIFSDPGIVVEDLTDQTAPRDVIAIGGFADLEWEAEGRWLAATKFFDVGTPSTIVIWKGPGTRPGRPTGRRSRSACLSRAGRRSA